MINRYYLDHAASTPILPIVLESMMPFLKNDFANPSAIYQEAQKVSAIIYEFRLSIAKLLNCQPHNLIFTSGATESNNLAIQGVGLAKNKLAQYNSILISPTEHQSAIYAAENLAKLTKLPLHYLKVDKYGLIELEHLLEQLKNKPLITIIGYASSDIGTRQPIELIVKLCNDNDVLIHVDASQAIGLVKINLTELNADSMAISSHKIYGPKGIGLTYIKNELLIEPIFRGTQEENRRAGTESLALISGLSKALQIAYEQDAVLDISNFTIQLKSAIEKKLQFINFTGHQTNRLANNISMITPLNSDLLLPILDIHGIAASSGSACSIGKNDGLTILPKIGYTLEQSKKALRFSCGRLNSLKDIAKIVDILDAIFKNYPQN